MPKCLECKQEKSPQVPFPEGVENACDLHWTRYLRGFTMHGTFKEFVDKKAKDPRLQERWVEAGQIIAGETVDWLPCDVTKATGIECTIERSMVAPTRAQLRELLSVSPERLGIKLQDLPDSSMTKVKGLLIPNPSRPFTEYNFKQSIEVKKKTAGLSSSSRCYTEQPDATYEYMKEQVSNKKEIETMLTKMRTEPWTLSDLVQKSCQHRGVPLDVANVSTLAATLLNLGGSGGQQPAVEEHVPPPHHDSGASEDADGDSGASDAPSIARTCVRVPALNRTAMQDSMSQYRVKPPEANSWRSSEHDGTPVKCQGRVKTKDGLPITDEDKDALVQRRTAALDISRVLSGEQLGREARWARDTRDLFLAKGDITRSDILDKHLVLSSHAETLAGTAIADLPFCKLEVPLKELSDAGEDFPSVIKHALWKRRVTDMQGDAIKNGTVDALVLASLPWAQGGGPDRDVFDPLKPVLACLEGSPLDRGMKFANALVDVLVSLVKQGDSGKALLLDVAAKMEEALDAHADVDQAEEYDQFVSDVWVCCRACRALLDARFVKGFADVLQLEKTGNSKDKQAKGSPQHKLHVALKSSQTYHDVLSEFNSKHEQTKHYMPEIVKLEGALSTPAVAAQYGDMRDALTLLPRLVATCRAGTFEGLSGKLETSLANYAESLQLHSPDYADASLCQSMQQLRTLLELAMQHLPGQTTRWAKNLQKVTSVLEELSKKATVSAFDTMSANVDESYWADEQKLSELKAAVHEMLGFVTAADDKHGEAIAKVALAGMKFMSASCSKPGDVAAPLDVLRLLLSATCLPEPTAGPLRDFVEAFAAWTSAAERMGDFMKLGVDETSRVKADAGDKVILAFLGELARFDSYRSKLSDPPPCLGAFRTDAMACRDNIKSEVYQQTDAALKASAGPLRLIAYGGDDGARWTSQIPAGKENDVKTIFEVGVAELGRLDGPSFSLTLEKVKSGLRAWEDARSYFGEKPDEKEHESFKDLIDEATVTMQTALMMLAWSTNESEPNSSKLRREIRKVRKRLQSPTDLHALVQAGLWAWSEDVSGSG